MTNPANATTEKTNAKGKSNAAASGDNAKTNGAKGKGGNDGKTPRALRGAPKPTAEWSQAQEEAFAKMQQQREQARLIRATGLGQVLDLLLAGIQPTILADAVEGKDAVLVDGVVTEPAVEAQPAKTELLASREELLANIEANGNALLTHLSTFFKLDPLLLKSINGEDAAK
ncbi:hypothetical protein PJWF_00080 [Achromobacter phage JWF]|uniref:hypothetical protein n=1 Tax=Achromobacter phage JWF TaxID=1589748 RepID=UPI000588E439|nr:hypothetical protein AXJ13_gp108 [Achromobacter phage JWF]AJD82973.1 hypothetical protein PJWF_00080 [Achromobacter phage JWF]